MAEVNGGRGGREQRPGWVPTATALPFVIGALALFGGQVGRTIALSVTGALALATTIVAQRRRSRRGGGYAVPPAQLLAVAVVAFVAAEAVGVGGVAVPANRGAIGDWTGVAACI